MPWPMTDGNFLFAAGKFSPPEAANSQFWLCSCMHKLCPHAPKLPKPSGCSIIIANSIPQGYKIGKGGGFGSLFHSFESFDYMQNFWSTLIGSNFMKKHVGLFFIFISAAPSTVVSGLRHLPPQMKNQHVSMRKKP
jgi:hypothetical protein